MKNKKVLIFSIVAVALLVISIVAVSYAAFTANLTGTKENKLNTGYVTLNCAETAFTLNNANPLTDAQGTALTGNDATCTLTSTMNGTMRVGYDIALADVTPSTNVTASDVKIRVGKSVDSATETYVAGTTETTGVTVASLASSTGQYDNQITGYKLDSDIITGNHSIIYTVKGWLSSEGSGGNGTPTTSTETGVCSDTTYETKAECEAAGGIWGDKQTASSAGGTFSFKLKLGATQVFPTTAS